MAREQRVKSAVKLKKTATAQTGFRILEASTLSAGPRGRELSAFKRTLENDGRTIPLECVYQAGKVFEKGGSFSDLLTVSPKEAKTDKRLKESGKLKGFTFEEKNIPLNPPSAFFDGLYLKSLRNDAEWILDYLEENNFQARSSALFLSLARRGITRVPTDFDEFATLLDELEPDYGTSQVIDRTPAKSKSRLLFLKD